MNSLIYQRDSKKDIYSAKAALEQSLKTRKFGVLTEIDVAKVMEEKGVDFDDELLLLGVCNPHFAKDALAANDDIAVSLPCSIVIQRTSTGSSIKLAKPTFIVNYYKSDKLSELGSEAEELLVSAIEEVVTDE